MPLLIVLAIAFFVPVALSRLQRLGIPVVVGEIIAGILVGKSGLDLVHEGPLLTVLSSLGLAYLMFLSGLEIDFGAISSFGSASQASSKSRNALFNPLFVGHVVFAGTLIGSVAFSLGLQAQGLIKDPWIMALILATTSLGVVVPVLKENGLARQGYGQTLLMAALVADFASILLISVYVLFRSHGLTVEVLFVLVLLAVFFATYRLVSIFRERLPMERLFSRLSSATSQIRTRGSFALALVFIALADGLGVENILGAFLAGVIVSSLSRSDGTVFRQKLDAIGYGFFIPVFFVMVGVNFDLPALLSSPSAIFLVPLLVAIAYAVKLGPAMLYRLQYTWRDTLAGGLLLSSRLSLIIAASAIGLEMGAISEAVNAAIVLVAIVTCTLSPILFNVFSPRAGPRDRVIIAGNRTISAPLARRLHQEHLEVVLISDDPAVQDILANQGVAVVSPLESTIETLRRADADRAKAILALDLDDRENLQICRIAHHVFRISNVVAWVDDVTKNEDFRNSGARVVNPSYSAMLVMESMVLNPGELSMSRDVDEAFEISEVKLRNRALIGQTLDGLPLGGDCMVLSIERSGNIFSPEGDTILEANDTLILAGTDEALTRLALMISQNKR